MKDIEMLTTPLRCSYRDRPIFTGILFAAKLLYEITTAEITMYFILA
jgi:hypothetical protein